MVTLRPDGEVSGSAKRLIQKVQKNGNIYIGLSSDLKTRYQAHNLGNVKSTKAFVPWKLIYYEAYKSKKDATKREKQLKMHVAKNELIKGLKHSLMMK
ncbi:GIY-YIG nuclease family protein [Patescibacteria group bacterium]|nr:GIY-YIG nuclease family protein [Patescibacteria group bacterium]